MVNGQDLARGPGSDIDRGWMLAYVGKSVVFRGTVSSFMIHRNRFETKPLVLLINVVLRPEGFVEVAVQHLWVSGNLPATKLGDCVVGRGEIVIYKRSRGHGKNCSIQVTEAWVAGPGEE